MYYIAANTKVIGMVDCEVEWPNEILECGLFKVEAALFPNSYILHPSCHLSGRFAMYHWFKSSQSIAAAGD